MRDNCYLVVGPNGVRKMVKTPPSLQSDEISVKINLSIPDKAFGRPKFEGTIELRDEHVEGVIKELEFKLKELKEEDS